MHKGQTDGHFSSTKRKRRPPRLLLFVVFAMVIFLWPILFGTLGKCNCAQASSLSVGSEGSAVPTALEPQRVSSNDLYASAAGEDLPQLIGLQVHPDAPVTGDHVVAKPVFSGEGATYAEDIPLTYRWWINGELVQEGEDPALQTNIRCGDRIVVEASMEGTEGESRVRELVVVGNAAPMISLGSQEITGSRYTAQLNIKDAEDDPVTIHCRNCPDGMKVVGSRIQWDFGTLRGTFPVVLEASDSAGGKTVLSFSISIREQNADEKSE